MRTREEETDTLVEDNSISCENQTQQTRKNRVAGVPKYLPSIVHVTQKKFVRIHASNGSNTNAKVANRL